MKVFVTGGTGLIGQSLIKCLLNRGYLVTILTRSKEKAEHIFGSQVDVCESLSLLNTFDGFDVVINLAGESIAGKRWNEKQKQELENSRWKITSQLSDLINRSVNLPKVFISGSAVGYYGAQQDNIITENSTPNSDFTSQLCKKWETLAMEAKTRVCILRTGIVLSSEGGMLSKMSMPFKWGLGGIVSKGEQYLSWVHIDDLVSAILFLIDNSTLNGAYNITSPNPVTNKSFSKILARRLNRPCFFKIPAFIIRLILGESSTLVLDGQKVIPDKLLAAGYKFRFEDLGLALSDILKTKS